jgi:septal ring factor EnvC (AmiA/AmiB activator)
MSTSQLQQTTANLRISLAQIENKERQLESMIAQFRTQLRRLPRQVIYGATGLDASLSALGEIEERLADVTATHRRLATIKKATMDELAALESVKQVGEARRSLADLKRLVRDSGEDSETGAEIRRLEAFIAEHSKRAELTITERFQERVSGS